MAEVFDQPTNTPRFWVGLKARTTWKRSGTSITRGSGISFQAKDPRGKVAYGASKVVRGFRSWSQTATVNFVSFGSYPTP